MSRVVIDSSEEDFDSPEARFIYIKGELPTIREYSNLKPLLSYEFVSLNASDFCFNYHELKVKDYISYFEVCKKISTESLKDLIDYSHHNYHFHMINLNEKKELDDKIRKHLGIKNKNSELPLICQFALYTEKEEKIKSGIPRAPRVIAMIHKQSYYILFIDYLHKTYPNKKLVKHI